MNRPTILNDDCSPLQAAGISSGSIQTATFDAHGRGLDYVNGLQERQRGFLSRFFTERGLSKVLEDTKIQQVKDITEYQRNLFRLATDTKLDMAHSMCLAMSRELKTGNQARFTTMIMDTHERLRRTVQTKRDSFLADIASGTQNAMKYEKIPWLMDQALQSLQRETGQFFIWLDSLLEDFMSISKQRLDEYRLADGGSNQRPGFRL